MFIGINSPNGHMMLNLDLITVVQYDKDTKLLTITTANPNQMVTIEDGSAVYNEIADRLKLEKI